MNLRTLSRLLLQCIWRNAGTFERVNAGKGLVFLCNANEALGFGDPRGEDSRALDRLKRRTEKEPMFVLTVS